MICTGPVWSLCLLRHAQRAQYSGTVGAFICTGGFLRGHTGGVRMNRQPVWRVKERVCGGEWKGLFNPRSAPAPIRCSWTPEPQDEAPNEAFVFMEACRYAEIYACLVKQHCNEVLTEQKPAAI